MKKIILSLIFILSFYTLSFAGTADTSTDVLTILQWVFGIISLLFFAMAPLILWYRYENKHFIPGTRAYNAAQLAGIIFFIINVVSLFRSSNKN